MTDRQLEECLRLLSEAQRFIEGQNRPYNRLSKVRGISDTGKEEKIENLGIKTIF